MKIGRGRKDKVFRYLKNFVILLYVYFGFIFLTVFCYSLIVIRVYLFHMRGSRLEKSCTAHESASLWGRLIMKMVPGWSIDIQGKENLPPLGKACIIVANHLSNADIWAVFLLPVQFRWLAKASVLKIPFIGSAMRIAGYIPVERGEKESQKQAMAASAEWLDQGIPMFFFPEEIGRAHV